MKRRKFSDKQKSDFYINKNDILEVKGDKNGFFEELFKCNNMSESEFSDYMKKQNDVNNK